LYTTVKITIETTMNTMLVTAAEAVARPTAAELRAEKATRRPRHGRESAQLRAGTHAAVACRASGFLADADPNVEVAPHAVAVRPDGHAHHAGQESLGRCRTAGASATSSS